MATTSTLPKLLDINELAEQLGTSQRHIRRLIADRRVPYLKVGRLIRFDAEDIGRWLDETRQPAEAVRGPRR
jgi:excisionase family DNA binding protein